MENIVVTIQQSKQNGQIQFICLENNKIIYKGNDSFISKFLPLIMTDSQDNMIFKYATNLKDLANDLGRSLIRHVSYIGRNGNVLDKDNALMAGFFHTSAAANRYYEIEYLDKIFQVYMWSTGRTPHLLVYFQNKQIAQIEKKDLTVNYLDEYTLYLLKEYEDFKAILSFFTLYYDKMEHGNHGEAFIGTKAESSVSFSIAGIGKDKYDPKFMEENFPGVEIVHKELGAKTIREEASRQWKEVKAATFNRTNFKKEMFRPLLIIVLVLAWILLSVVLLLIERIVGIAFIIGFPILILIFYWFVWMICRKRP